MSHYPSSAELAAFRRSIGSRRGNLSPCAPPHDGGAFEHERREGINGHLCVRMTMRHIPGMPECTTPGILPMARREASAMRSRAYRRMARDCDARWMLPALDLLHPDGSYFGPWLEETHFGVPYTFHPGYRDL